MNWLRNKGVRFGMLFFVLVLQLIGDFKTGRDKSPKSSEG